MRIISFVNNLSHKAWDTGDRSSNKCAMMNIWSHLVCQVSEGFCPPRCQGPDWLIGPPRCDFWMVHNETYLPLHGAPVSCLYGGWWLPCYIIHELFLGLICFLTMSPNCYAACLPIIYWLTSFGRNIFPVRLSVVEIFYGLVMQSCLYMTFNRTCSCVIFL